MKNLENSLSEKKRENQVVESLYCDDADTPITFEDDHRVCPVCNSSNGHSFGCATLNLNKKTIEHE